MDEAKASLGVEPFHRAGWHLASPSVATRYIFRQPIRTIKGRWSYGLAEPQAKRHGAHLTDTVPFTGTMPLTFGPSGACPSRTVW